MSDELQRIDPIMAAAMQGRAPEACPRVVEVQHSVLTRAMDVIEFGDQLERVEKDRMLAYLREILALPQDDLFAMHCVGPCEIHPMISQAVAQREADALLALCKQQFPDIPMAINVIPSPFTPAEHYELLAEDLHEQVEDLSEALKDAKASPLTAAACDVLAERERQVKAEGWTPEHDDEHDGGELSAAAAAYALHAADHLHPQSQGDGGDDAPDCWPWHDSVPGRGEGPERTVPAWWKPGAPRRSLIKAAALILAEIERLDRAEARKAGDA